MAKQWFYRMMGDELGPISSSELKSLVEKKQVVRDTKVRLGTDGKWHSAEKIKGLFSVQEVVPPKSVEAASEIELTAADLIWDDSDDFL